jgi:hypothetical protein
MQRSNQLQEIVIINQYLRDFQSITNSFLNLKTGDLEKNVELSYLSALLSKNKKVLNTRLEFLTQKEMAWQEKTKVMKFLDLSVWKLLEMRNSFTSNVSGKKADFTTQASIDRYISFSGFSSGLLYLPRALQIGFLSPFPTHWVEKGNITGRAGRVISGFEMIIMYMIYIGFLYTVILKFALIKRLIPVIVLSAMIITLTGYVFPNIGIVFRFRIDFIVPIFMIGSFGVSLIINNFSEKIKNILSNEI